MRVHATAMKPNRPARRQNLLTRALAANVVLVGASLACLMGLFLVTQRSVLQGQLEARSGLLAESLAGQSELAMLVRNRAELERIATTALASEDVVYVLMQDAAGHLLAKAARRGFPVAAIPGFNGKQKSPRSATVFEEPGSHQKFIDIGRPVAVPSDAQVLDWEPVRTAGSALGEVRVGFSMAKQRLLFERTVVNGAMVAVVTLMVIFTVQFLQLRRMLLPLHELVRFTRKVAAGDLKQRAPVVTINEVSDLSESFNHMVEKLDRAQAERDKAEAELRLAQKLEAIGQLASGIAHEINTPMQYIGDSVYFLRESFEELLGIVDAQHQAGAPGPGAGTGAGLDKADGAEEGAGLDYLRQRVPRALERTREGIERVSSIVRAMKEFAHPDSEEKCLTDLNRALSNALVVSRNEYKYVADVETDFGPIPLVPCHAGEINQVFLNLLVNAAHAIGDVVKGSGGKGLIRVRTALKEEVVVIQIEDTGTGIREEIRDRVFDPFFTTKPVGRGTGQGLAIARSIIVGKHGGSLTFSSEVGKGTTFTIHLPAAVESGAAHGVKAYEETNPVR
jgi:signal transduction histidine kinase